MLIRSFLNRVPRPGDVAQVHGVAALASDDQVLVRVGALELTARAQKRRAGRTVELTRARVGGAVLDRGARSSTRAAGPHRRGIALMRTADLVPKTFTRDTPGRMLIRCRLVLA